MRNYHNYHIHSTTFHVYSNLEDIKLLRSSFLNSDIVHVPRTANQKKDNLARSVRHQSSFVVHMYAEFPIWFTEST